MLQGFFVFFIFVVKRNVYHECQKKFGTRKRKQSYPGIISNRVNPNQHRKFSTVSNSGITTGVSFNSVSSTDESSTKVNYEPTAQYNVRKDSTKLLLDHSQKIE